MTQFYALNCALTACTESNLRRPHTLDPAAQKTPIFCTLGDTPRPTGLLPPHPQWLYPLTVSDVLTGHPTVLVTEAQIHECLSKVYQIKQGDRFRLLRDMRAHDNCFNAPQSLIVPKGTELVATASASTDRGDYFFTWNNRNVDLHDLHTLHPYGMPVVLDGMIELLTD